MYHVVIDLEMCRVPRRSSADYRYKMETIQIGAVLLDENFGRIGTLSEYVNPSYGAIDSFIGNLTGIRQSDLRGAPKLEEALIRADIRPEGRFHDGLDDAVNTGKLIQKLELDPAFELTAGYVPPVSDAPLSCSFGDLLAKMQIKVG